MKKLKTDLKAVTKELKSLTKKTERMLKAVDKLDKSQAPKKRKVKAQAKVKSKAKAKAKAKVKVKAKVKKTRKAPARKKAVRKKASGSTATERVLSIIKKSSKGVGVPTLIKKTGFEDKKIRNIVFRAFKQGKVERSGKGIYKAA